MHARRGQPLQTLEAHCGPKEVHFAPENSGRRTANTCAVGEPSDPKHKRKRTETEAVEDLTKRQLCESAAMRTNTVQ